MKKVILLALALFSMKVNAQNILKSCDDMSNECLYFTDAELILANDSKTKGIKVSPSIEEKDGKIFMSGLIVKMVNIGVCCENNELIVMFSDSTKATFKSWNKFNCEGDAYFDVAVSDWSSFFLKPILKIKIENGYTHDSFTGSIKDSSRNYFINVGKNILANKWTKYED